MRYGCRRPFHDHSSSFNHFIDSCTVTMYSDRSSAVSVCLESGVKRYWELTGHRLISMPRTLGIRTEKRLTTPQKCQTVHFFSEAHQTSSFRFRKNVTHAWIQFLAASFSFNFLTSSLRPIVLTQSYTHRQKTLTDRRRDRACQQVKHHLKLVPERRIASAERDTEVDTSGNG